jgi:NADH:ubiquinone oxidoreductase subunit F (NADH-binding)
MVAATEQGIVLTGEPVTSLAEYRRRGGCRAYERVVQSDPEEIVEQIRHSGLRGRGGAGFPTALKWQSLRAIDAHTKYMVCNAAEGEPGTFKDRMLLQHNHYQLLEGLAIARQIIEAKAAYIGVKQQFRAMLAGLERARAEMQAETPIARDIEIVWGPDEYLFGEEKALVNVIDGGLPMPRVLPPYMHGLFTGAYGGPGEEYSNPTCVNNVETLSHVTHIIERGPEWFRAFGTDDTPGTMVFSVLGDVQRPFVRELPLGVTVRVLIDLAGSVAEGRKVKAAFPGLAGNIITEAMLDTPLGFDSIRNAGAALGSGGFVVLDDTACMVQALAVFAHFLYIESCNQCPPCKIGSRRITRRLDKLVAGEATAEELEELVDTATWVTNGQRCALPNSTQLLTASIMAAFPREFEDHLAGRCARRHDFLLPKIKDYREGEGFTFDTEY